MKRDAAGVATSARAGAATARRGRPLRVAMIHLSDFRLDSRVQREARALAERGEEVHLICIGERERLRVGAGTIEVHPVRARKAGGGAGAYVRAYGNFLARALARVTMLDARRRFDLVQAHNMPNLVVAAALLPRLRGTPLILDVHDTFPELFATKFARAPGDRAAQILGWEERVCASLASRVIVVTEQARLRLAGRGVGKGRTSVVMNSPDERVFGPPRPPVRWPLRGPLRVLYHGGLAERFGVESVIRAVGLLGGERAARCGGPEVHLRICGAGDAQERDRLAALAGELAPGRVAIAREPIPFAQIPGELARAHVGVVPTLADSFTELLLPVKLLECVHMGLPVVASRLPCIAEYFGERELCMYGAGNAEDLAGALRALCADPARARERAARATQRLAGIAWEGQRAGYLALVDELTGGGGASTGAKRASASAATRSARATMDSPLSSRG